MTELLQNQAFRYYIFCAAALALNPLILAFLTGGWRGKYKSPATPEDAKLAGTPYREEQAPEVSRVGRAHRNALESVPLMIMFGLLYVLAGASATMVLGLMGACAALRWLHSIFYLSSVQPWRTAAFGLSSLSLIAMIIHTIVLVARAG